jgi:hypothetical protein
VNRTLRSFFAASGTPRRPIDVVLRLCVRATAVCEVLPLVDPLPSTASPDESAPSPFGSFFGTMGASDFPSAYMSDVGLLAFSDRHIEPSAMGTGGTSRLPCKELPRIHMAFDSAGLEQDSRLQPCSMLPSAELDSVGVSLLLISELNVWSACTPVNASPAAPHDDRRMTRAS